MALVPFTGMSGRSSLTRAGGSDLGSRRRISRFMNEDDDFFGDSLLSSSLKDFGGSSTRNMMNQMMGGMMRDPFENDPFFGGSPFGALMGPQMGANRGNQMALSPFGSLAPMMSSMENMAREGSCHSYSSSSVMTMSTGPDGRPQVKALGATNSNGFQWRETGSRGLEVYQATASSHGVPGGARETKRTVLDSKSGLRKMAIGHHINDRSHVIEKEMRPGGELEERQEYINLDEEEAPEFNNEFQRMTQHGYGQSSIEGRPRTHRSAPQSSHHRSTYMPALAAPSSYRRRTRPMLSLTYGSSRPDDKQKHRDRGTHRRNH